VGKRTALSNLGTGKEKRALAEIAEILKASEGDGIGAP